MSKSPALLIVSFFSHFYKTKTFFIHLFQEAFLSWATLTPEVQFLILNSLTLKINTSYSIFITISTWISAFAIFLLIVPAFLKFFLFPHFAHDWESLMIYFSSSQKGDICSAFDYYFILSLAEIDETMKDFYLIIFEYFWYFFLSIVKNTFQ